MPKPTSTRRTVRLEDGRAITLYPLASILSPRTRALLRAMEKERHAASRVHRAGRPHRLG